MHLVVGHPDDFCCAALVKRLAAEGLDVRLTAAPLEAPSRHALRIDCNGRTSAAFRWAEGPTEPVESVFVRASGFLDPGGWDPLDHIYMQTEVQAAMLAWLSALDCPVVNRLDAELWYRPQSSLLHWLAPLRAAGLSIPDTIISDCGDAISGFRQTLEGRSLAGAVLTSLARHERWLVGEDEWSGVLALGRHGPVCLSEPHGPARSLCVVGDTIAWNEPPLAADAALAGRLLRFARQVDLLFVEMAIAPIHDGMAVVHVDPMPRLEHFNGQAQDQIISLLSDLLLARGPAAIAAAQS